MDRKPRDKRHLITGLLFLLAGAFFVVGGLNVGKEESSYSLNEYLIKNSGEGFGGHTPIGFSGEGTGLFLGDNLNSNFPNTDGVQAFISFDIEELKGEKIKSAVLYSEFAKMEGEPFASLGGVLVEEVSFGSFSSKVWNTESLGTACLVSSLSDGVFSCDITELLQTRTKEEKNLAQLRLRFENISDGDGEKDLLLFYKTNSNQNEKGIFNIRVNDVGDQEPGLDFREEITLPIVLRRVVNSGELSTNKTEEEVLEVFKNTERIWGEANIFFDVAVEDTVLDEEVIGEVGKGNFRELYSVTINEPLSLHIYFMENGGGPNGIAFPPLLAVIADETTVSTHRAVAREIGHLLGLIDTEASRDRLMFQGANGEELSAEEVVAAREYAEEFEKEIENRDE